jgi:hypothetical protein
VRVADAPVRVADAPVRVAETRTVAVGTPRMEAASSPRAASTSASANVGFLELLGSSPADRWGVVLIAAGAVAVLYALLTSLRFG